MLNVIALQGRLVRDPELRQTTTGKQVATFTLACAVGGETPAARLWRILFPSLRGNVRRSSPTSGSPRA